MSPISSAAYVTAVLNFLHAFNRGEFDELEQQLDSQIEWHSAGRYVGRDEVTKMLRTLAARYSNCQARPDDFKEAHGHVLMVICFHEGDPNAQPHEQRQSWIVDLSDEGLMQRVLSYESPAEAARSFDALAAAAPKVPA